MLRKLLLALLLLSAPAWAAFAVGTPEFELRTADCTTSCPMGTFTVNGTGTLIIQAAIRGTTDSTPANGFGCTVGGVNAPYVTGSSSGTGAASQTRNYEILPANLPAAGSQAVECSTPSGTINSVHLTIFQVTGLTGATAEAVFGADDTIADTTADAINNLTAGAFVAFSSMYQADPGTVTAGGGQTELLNKSAQFDTRWAHSSYKTGATPPTDTTGGTTHTSAFTSRSIVAYEIQAADVTPPTPGAGVTITGATPNSLNVAVVAGTDDVTAQASLEYEFRRSLSSNMASVANAEANGTIVRAYTANDVTHTDTGLTSGVTYFYQVIIRDAAGNKAIHTTAKEAALAISDAGVVMCRCGGLYDVPEQTLPDGQESVAYPETTLTVLGGVVPRAWTVDSGALPGGLSLSTDGVITGTVDASEAGTHNFTAKVTDADGGLAYRQLSIVIDVAAGGSLNFYEDAEDGNLTSAPVWTAAGGCAVTSTGDLEGNDEVTKSSATDCVLFDNVNEPQVFYETDIELFAATTNRDEAVIGLGSGDEELFSIRFEADSDIFAKTPGQTGFETGGVPRGFYLGNMAALGYSSARIGLHYLAGTTGANTTFRAKIQGGAYQTFSAGTATANVDRIILRDDNDGAGDFVFDRIAVKDDVEPGLAPLVPVDPPPPPDPPGVWVTDFIPVRIHYVTVSGSGSANGTIGNPESFLTSISGSHYQNGDLHIYRAGVYTDANHNVPFTKDCIESGPCVFKGYVDPATGQPENVEWRFEVSQPGRWNWFVNIHCDQSVSQAFQEGCMEFRKAGNRAINNVLHDTRASTLLAFRNAGASEPDQVFYGNVLYRAGAGDNGAHNTYTTNDFDTGGFKYFVQNLYFEPQDNLGRRLFQANDSNADRGLSGFHLEKNFFGDANQDDGNTIVWTQGLPGTGNKEVIFKDNVMADFYHSSSLQASVRMGSGAPVQFQMTGNYFARTNMWPEGYWGNSGAHPTTTFTGNEIYDPPGGIHIHLDTKGISGALGSHKIPDADNWNNNIYGGTAQFQLFANGVNSGTLSLTNWRTATDAARVTPASAVGFDIGSTNPANPTTNKVVVTVNEYQCSSGCPFTDQARGNIYCVNWAASSTCTADISTVVGPGKTYVVRYPRDFFGTAAVSGTCPASGACNVSPPTRRNSAAASGKFANAWVITGQP